MSRIGKKPIELPKGVEVKIDGQTVRVKGQKGQLERVVHNTMSLNLEGTTLTVVPKVENNENKKFWGLTRSLVSNMVVGVSDGFERRLKLIGVGYRAAQSGKGLTLNLGYSHPTEYQPPEGIDLKVDKQTTLIVTGAEKEKVGLVAAKLRSFRPPEPYHGKGVRYEDEHIATKVGKAAGKK